MSKGDGETPPPAGEEGTERAIGVALVVSAVAAVGLAVVYARGGQVQAEGALLGLSLASLGWALAAWGRHLLPSGPFEQLRHALPSATDEVAAAAESFEGGGRSIGRRRFLVRLLIGAGTALGVAALFPIRSLGPNPGRSLFRTSWRPGARLVTQDGQAVRLADLQVGGVVTVFPEGQVGDADAQTLLIRAVPEEFRTRPGRDGWSPGGHVAYSKVCTHAGCPVGLYQVERQQLLCPCHQSLFDVLDGARPVFGPATRSLPQLPLAVDDEGYLVARSDFTEPVGPAFWNR
ncbi:MAG: ubiquinol-cytochrome c reductase iron-sulfur subunit, partial [Acidimicrobiales bacterium]